MVKGKVTTGVTNDILMTPNKDLILLPWILLVSINNACNNLATPWKFGSYDMGLNSSPYVRLFPKMNTTVRPAQMLIWIDMQLFIFRIHAWIIHNWAFRKLWREPFIPCPGEHPYPG